MRISDWSSDVCSSDLATRGKKGGDEIMPAMLGKRFVDQLLRVGIGGAAQRQRDGTERQLEQPVAAPRLKVIMPLGRRSRDKFDLAFIEPAALIGRARLRLDRPVVGEQDSLRAALDRKSTRLNSSH